MPFIQFNGWVKLSSGELYMINSVENGPRHTLIVITLRLVEYLMRWSEKWS